jgi:hypothetical protein
LENTNKAKQGMEDKLNQRPSSSTRSPLPSPSNPMAANFVLVLAALLSSSCSFSSFANGDPIPFDDVWEPDAPSAVIGEVRSPCRAAEEPLLLVCRGATRLFRLRCPPRRFFLCSSRFPCLCSFLRARDEDEDEEEDEDKEAFLDSRSSMMEV